MGGMTLGKSAEQMLKERQAIDFSASNRRGERSLEDIKADEFLAGSRSLGEGPFQAYERLKKDAEEGRYASPVLNRRRSIDSPEPIPAGDVGQFFGSSSSGSGPSRQLGSMVMNEEEEAKKRPPKRVFQREFSKGGSVSSASSRGDGCAQRGKTRGRYL